MMYDYVDTLVDLSEYKFVRQESVFSISRVHRQLHFAWCQSAVAAVPVLNVRLLLVQLCSLWKHDVYVARGTWTSAYCCHTERE
jgi:hypothetical protein